MSSLPQPLAVPSAAKDLVAYQPGSVVSRQLIKKSASTVTAFAFAQGESLSEHTAPFDALVHVLEGRAKITIGGQAHDVDAGQLLLLPANVPHTLYADEAFKMILIMIRA